MKSLTIQLLCVLFVAFCTGCQFPKSGSNILTEAFNNDVLVEDDNIEDGDVDSSSISVVESSVPYYLKHYNDAETWNPDTICTVNGKTYCYAYDEYSRTSIVYSEDGLLCEDPALVVEPVSETSKTKFRVSTSYKKVLIDFADDGSIDKLRTFTRRYRRVRRFNMDYLAQDIGNTVIYHIDVDFPYGSSEVDDNIRKWLIYKVNASQTKGNEVPEPNAFYIGYKKQDFSDWRYEGNTNDIQAIGKFASDKYFAIKEMEYGKDRSEYPGTLFCDLSLRLICTNGRFYSYQIYTHEIDGGAHGFYTESIETLDAETNEDVNWNYLFVPGSENDIISLLYKVVQKDVHYQQWEAASTIDDIREHFEIYCGDDKDGHITLPKPGLSRSGVVFSFQPYAISCFAAGCFHFTIPYKALKPFMTEKAKRLIGI